jgi:soluble lytic murein transglycosylase-like protein
MTVLAAAFAVGVTAFAAHARDELGNSGEVAVTVTPSAEQKKADASQPTEAVAVEKANRKKVAGKGEAAAANAGQKTTKLEQKLAEAKSPGGRYGTIIARYASAYGVPESLARAVIQIESNYRPDALGSAGEIGLMQIKPATARLMGYSGTTEGLYHPETNIKFGMKYLGKAHKLGGGTICGTILKYNAGHAAKRMNKVSSVYCSKVKRHLAS